MTTRPRCWLLSQVHQSSMKLKCKWRAKWNRFSTQYVNDLTMESLPHVHRYKCNSWFNDILPPVRLALFNKTHHFLHSWFFPLLSNEQAFQHWWYEKLMKMQIYRKIRWMWPLSWCTKPPPMSHGNHSGFRSYKCSHLFPLIECKLYNKKSILCGNN